VDSPYHSTHALGKRPAKILALLSDHPEGLTPRQIRFLTGISTSVIHGCLKRDLSRNHLSRKRVPSSLNPNVGEWAYKST
jgi:hypothetical protein